MVPWLRLFASNDACEIAKVIARSDPQDWRLDKFYAVNESLGLRVWHCNQGYGFEVYLGTGDGAPKVINGGPDGERAWHAFKALRSRFITNYVQRACIQKDDAHG